MDDYLVLAAYLAVVIVGFFWRRFGLAILYYLWLGLIWLETQLRKWRDRKKGPRSI